MTKRQTKKVVLVVAVLLVASMVLMGLVACNKPGSNVKQGTYRTYTTVMPSNWNELTYEDNNDTQILDYIVSNFFEYDYKFDEALGGKFKEDGTVNFDAIVPGAFETKYSAATSLEDVTASVDAKWGYTAEQKEAGGYAWKITLRQDLKWDDGTPIDANDFVYSMQQQLDYKFLNMRASTYYNNTRIKNARNYVFQQGPVYNDFVEIGYPDVAPVADGSGYLSITTDGETYELYTSFSQTTVFFANSMKTYYNAGYDGYFCTVYTGDTSDPDALPDYVFADGEDDDVVYYADLYAKWIGKEDERGYIRLTQDLLADLKVIALNFGDTNSLAWHELAFYYAGIGDAYDWDNVGIYAPSQYELVVCMDTPLQLKKEDGSLSYLAAYNFASLPLVKKDLYESCKIAPQQGSTLWTTNYNSSLETSASWGPYKLTQFQGGKSYTLSRNEYWYGYALEDNKNQYNITEIQCEVIADVNTAWMSFLSGAIDDIGLDVAHKDDYRNSKYTMYAPGTGTFGINLYSGLDVLKTNGHNAGILAIKDFREAISLYLDRDDYNATLYTSHRSCYGLLGPSYYYDVENGGVYRNTQIAKEALLRVYGFTQKDNGYWTDGTRDYDDYQEAYDAMNGMNRTKAKQLIETAYTELTNNAANYGYDASKKITLVFGTSADNENSRRSYDYLVNFFAELTNGTSLEGKIELKFDASFGDGWASDFKAGAYEIAAGTGFSGGAFDPEGFLQCYVDPEAGLMYSTWWDTDAEMFTYTMPAGDYEGAGQELTMSVLNWYCCLNSMAEDYANDYNITYTYNWGAGAIPEEARMMLLGAIEELVLNKYYTVITTSQFSATLLGAKFSNASAEYNTFMGFGGMRYMTVNYNDSEWADYVSSQNNDLTNEYKKTN